MPRSLSKNLQSPTLGRNTSSFSGANGMTPEMMSQYDDLVRQYQNTRFEDLLTANPYLRTSRVPSGLEKFLMSLGLRTNYQRDIESNALAAREYAAQVVQTAGEEEYNSEAAQASRQRAAGLNPDLLGVSAGQAAEFAQEQTSPEISGGEEAQLGQIASMCMNVLTASVGFAKDLQSFRLLRNQVESGEIDNASSMLELAIKGVGLSPVLDEEGDIDQYSQLRDIEERLTPLFRSRRNKSRFKDAFSASAVSLRHHLDSYKVAGDYEQARKDFLSRRSSKYYDSVDETMQGLLSPLVRAQEDLAKRQIDRDKKSADFENEKLDKLDPALAASAENASNEMTVQEKDMNKNANSVLAEIISNLAQSARNGNFLSQAALLLFSVFRGRIGM